MEDNTGIFREKNLRKATDPEHLDRYLKVTGISSWVIVLAGALIVVFLMSWAVLGKLDNVIQGAAPSDSGRQAICRGKTPCAGKIPVRINSQTAFAKKPRRPISFRRRSVFIWAFPFGMGLQGKETGLRIMFLKKALNSRVSGLDASVSKRKKGQFFTT